MADGRVFVSGGSAVNNAATGVAYTSEIFDPATSSWSTGPTATRMRLYHSTSLLLPDATVITMGGGTPGPETNLNAEIYYPPYLFDGDGNPAARPTIAFATTAADPGTTLAIEIARRGVDRAGLVGQARLGHPLGRHGPALPRPALHRLRDHAAGDAAGERQPHAAGPLHDLRRSTPPACRRRRRSCGSTWPANRRRRRPRRRHRPRRRTTTTTTTTPTDHVDDVQTSTTTTTSTSTTTSTTLDHHDDAATTAAPACRQRRLRDQLGAERNHGRGDQPAGWTSPSGGIEVWRSVPGTPPGRAVEHRDRSGRTRQRSSRPWPPQAGRRYTLSFLQSPRPGVATSSNKFTVHWNGTNLGTVARNGKGLTTTSWQPTTFTVTGPERPDLVPRERHRQRRALIDDVRLVAN